MKSILDRSFRYVPSGKTDLRKTFARIRRAEMAKKAAEEQKNAEEAARKVAPIRKAK